MGKDDTNTNPDNMAADELPDVRAFEDEFTRTFLQSTEETRPGYYPFVSGTGAYRMDFPAGGVIGDKGYGKDGNSFEGYLVGVDNGNGTESSIKVNYYSYKKSEYAKSSTDGLEDRLEKKLKFNQISSDNQTLYLAPFEYEDNTYGYAALVQNEVKSGAVLVVYTTECTDTNSNCQDLKESQNKSMIAWIKSIEFLQENKESE